MVQDNRKRLLINGIHKVNYELIHGNLNKKKKSDNMKKTVIAVTHTRPLSCCGYSATLRVCMMSLLVMLVVISHEYD